jgi:tetratricopeptide (TPR) repeat protein
MDILEMMVRSEENYFPHGVYWCIRDESDVSKKVQKLLRRENTFWVKIDGFDDFMAELHDKLGLLLPKAISNPYEATTQWLNNFISPKQPLTNSIIMKDIIQIQKQIENFEHRITSGPISKDFDPLVPYELLGNINFRNDEFGLALVYYSKELKKDENNTRVIGEMVRCNINLEDFDEALKLVEQLMKIEPNNLRHAWYKTIIIGYQQKFIEAEDLTKKSLLSDNLTQELKEDLRISLSNLYLKMSKYDEAIKQTDIVLSINSSITPAIINRCIALKKLNQESKIKEELRKVITDTKNHYFKACAYATLEEREKMLKELTKAIKEDYFNKIQAKFDPDFEDYRHDNEFKKLLGILGN